MTATYRLMFCLYGVVALGIVAILANYGYSEGTIMAASVAFVIAGGAASALLEAVAISWLKSWTESRQTSTTDKTMKFSLRTCCWRCSL